ncbi:hypothetical protein [Planotetraspora kaengkrachanensis]|uniref:Uncharacterized protein n=1 Tax=Planotetraspora kaengkrachanensis TaxID=575193 RepID=A0A8J3M291_9ACTN|nr:hypothetical protein [Planotetraspora kaengkrachanensis]GIG80878.1 hypothetical protein Pka01_40050 [Planotetraspora kaengkrachanensis]
MTDTPASAARRKRSLRKPLLWALAAVAVLVAVFAFFPRDDSEQAGLPFVMSRIQEDEVRSATLDDGARRIEITTTDGRRFHAEWQNPGQARELTDALLEAQPVDGYTVEVQGTRFLWDPFSVSLLGAVVAAVVAVLVTVPRRARRRVGRIPD